MSIYSANRTGSMCAAMAVANESYKPCDLGRIMYESQVNDMAIFEAIVAADLSEIKGLREGTLLLAEAEEGNKKSIKGLIELLKKKIIEFWQKIKNAFEVAIRKIAAYLLGDNKAFIKNFREVYAKKGAKGLKFDGVKKVKIYDVDAVKGTMPTPSEIESIIKEKKDADNIKSADVVKEALTKALGTEVASASDYKEKAAETYGVEKDISKNEINEMIKILENASSTIKVLKELQKETATNIDKVVKVLKDAEKEVDRKDRDVNVIRNLSTLVGAYESVISCITATGIGMVKKNVKTSRSTLGKILSEMSGEDEVQKEAAADIANDEVDTALTDAPVEPELDPETKEAVDTVVAAADSEIEA